MPLAAKARLGAYEILAPLGPEGSGEVYAKDATHNDLEETVTDNGSVLVIGLINVVHEHAPQAKLCFNTLPSDTAEAVKRWL